MNRFSVIKSKAFLFLSTIFLLHSCASHKDVVYFQGVGDYETNVGENNHSQTFKVDDVVSINVSTLDPQASMPFNLITGVSDTGLRGEQLDYIVDKSGNIDFPVVGQVKIAGLTAENTKQLLKEKLSNYLKDPIVNIRLKNFTVTILGEVKSPGTYPVIGEQITILEALGLANDLTIKGKRDNVLVIRDFDGTKVYHRINLTSKEALDSPVYYLTQNDVVYVEPNKSAITASALDNRATIWVSVASVLITSTVLVLTRN